MGIVSTLVVKVTASISDYEKQLQNVERGWSRTAGKLQSIGADLTKALTVPLAGVALGAGKAAADFETSFSGIRKTVQATEAEYGQLAQAMRNLALEKPVDVNTLDKIGEQAGQLGIAKENIVAFTSTIADLTVATNLTADEAGSDMARIANVMQMPMDNIGRMGSAVVSLGNFGAATEQQMLDFAQRIAGAGAIAGMSVPNILAIGNAFASAGVEAERGGTAVQMALLKMEQAVTTGKNLDKFGAISGLSGDQFKDLFQQNPAEAFTKFVEGLGKAGPQAIAMLQSVGLSNQRVMQSFLNMSKAGDLLRNNIDVSNQSWEQNTALTRASQQRYGTFANQLKSFSQQLYDIGITLGQALLPIFGDVLTLAKPVVDVIADLAKGFAQLPEPVRLTVVAIGGIAAGLGPALYVFGTFQKAASDFLGLVRMLGGPLEALEPVFTTIGGLVEGAVAAFTSWDGITALLAGAFEVLTGPIGMIAAAVGVIAPLVWNMIGGWDGVTSAIDGLIPVLATIEGFFSDVGTIASYLVTAALNKLRDWFYSFLSIAGSFYDSVEKYVIAPLVHLGGIVLNASGITTFFSAIGTAAHEAYDWVHKMAASIPTDVALTPEHAVDPRLSQPSSPSGGAANPFANLLQKFGIGGSPALPAAIKNLGGAAGAAARQLDEFDRSVATLVGRLSGRDAVDAANEWVAAVNQIGGAQNLTDQELKQFTDNIVAAVDKMRQLGQVVPETWAVIADGAKEMQALKQSTDMLGQSLKEALKLAPNQLLLPTDDQAIASIQSLAMSAMPADMKSQTDNVGSSLGRGLGASLETGLSASLKSLPNIITGAFQGGGNVFKSIASKLGGDLGSSLVGSLAGKLTGTLTSTLGQTLGGAIGGLLGPLGAAVGSLVGPLVGKLGTSIGHGIEGLFGTDEEARLVNPARDQFLKQFGAAGTGEGSGFATLAAKLTEITGDAGGGALFQALLNADTMAKFNTAIDAINERLQLAGTSASDLANQFSQLSGLQGLLATEQANGASPQELANIQAQIDALKNGTTAVGDATNATTGLAGALDNANTGSIPDTASATNDLTASVSNSGDALTALGATSGSVAQQMLSDFDKLLAKLDALLAALRGAGGALGAVGGATVPAPPQPVYASIGGAPMSVPAPVAGSGSSLSLGGGSGFLYNTAGQQIFDPNGNLIGTVGSGMPAAGHVISYANEGYRLTTPHLAVVGDAAEPEYVLHESTLKSFAGSAGKAVSVSINAGTIVGNAKELASMVLDAIEQGGPAYNKARILMTQMAGA